MLSTPSRITADIRRLCRRIGGLDESVFVEVSPRASSPLANCFMDVRMQVEKRGGSIQHGWTLWEWPGIFAEGEFHAVWRSPDGLLLDVSPKQDGERRILFAPDPKRVFVERRVDNIRMPIGRDPRIIELIAVNEQFQRHVSRLMQGVPFGTPFVIEGEACDLRERAAQLEMALMQSRDARRASSASSFQISEPL